MGRPNLSACRVTMSHHSLVLELHALPFLSRVARQSGAADLGAIPGSYLREIRRRGFDAVWLMGVWERSPVSRGIALEVPALREEYEHFFSGWSPEEVAGSPYSIRRYVPDARLGGWEGLGAFREKANQLGLKVFLDFVPNHLACDHPWIGHHPEFFVGMDRIPEGDEKDIFFKSGPERWTAHGKDPYFPAWTDTAQVNYFSQDARKAMADELVRLSSRCDGLRCDMAMLPLNDVFGRTWGRWVSPPEGLTEFWSEAIRSVKTRFPQTVFIAEVYWGLEQKLLEQGFDYVYDKVLYDHLLEGAAGHIRDRLRGSSGLGSRALRFAENHDEKRAIDAFGRDKSFAASVIALTSPGLGLIHDGQEDGRGRKAPVQLGRWPDAEPDEILAERYRHLLLFLSDTAVRDGLHEILDPLPAWEGNGSNDSWVVQCWRQDSRAVIAAVNFSGQQAQARVRFGDSFLNRSKLYFRDLTDGKVYERDAESLRREGLFLDQGAWGIHLWVVDL